MSLTVLWTILRYQHTHKLQMLQPLNTHAAHFDTIVSKIIIIATLQIFIRRKNDDMKGTHTEKLQDIKTWKLSVTLYLHFRHKSLNDSKHIKRILVIPELPYGYKALAGLHPQTVGFQSSSVPKRMSVFVQTRGYNCPDKRATNMLRQFFPNPP
jgi:hypothetical protein